MNQKPSHQTLGDNVIPTHYTLSFEPNLNTFIFKGRATIDLTIKKPTRKVVLHAKELQLHQAQWQQAEAEIAQEEEEVTLTFPQPLQGKGQLYLEFTGKHNDGMYGFYRSKYLMGSKERYLLTTQFEAANARAAFPCFDEPAYKATFDVSLIVNTDATALSNMPVKGEHLLLHGKKQVVFHTTPRMSTYLLYLGVGHFQSISMQSGKVLLRAFTTPDKIHLAPLSLGYAKTFLHFFEKYFGIPYPLPKLDLIAIPDFAAGAMENWGAITFREIALLGDEKTSVTVKQNIAITVSHELAHQWFGNLVTMQWWDDLWLNESFATFMSYKAVHASYPEWDLPLQYFEDTIADALSADQLESTHPINVEVKKPGEVDEIFDNISYDKGGSVLHMLENYVGEKTFQKGLSSYLKTHAYQNATKHDLWGAIQKACQERTLTRLVEGWITFPGYPVVEVSATPSSYSLRQMRFTLTGKRYNQLWTIPLSYQTAEGKVKKVLLRKENLDVEEKSPWIKVNASQHGFYRVKYSPALLQQLSTAIHKGTLSPLDAAGIENDFFAFTIAGDYVLKDYLAFVKTYCGKLGFPANYNLSAHLAYLLRTTLGTKLEAEVRSNTVAFHLPLLRQLGWNRRPDEKNALTMLRTMAISSLGLAGHKETIQKVQQLFKQIKEGKEVDPNLRGTVYTLAAWHGKPALYNYFVERYKKETLPEEGRKLLRALAMFRDKETAQHALELSQSSVVRLQDSFVIPLSTTLNPLGSALLWGWTKKNWPQFIQKYSGGTHMLAHFVQNLAFLDTPRQQREFQEFFSKKENQRDDIKMAIRQTLERIQVNMAFRKKNRF